MVPENLSACNRINKRWGLLFIFFLLEGILAFGQPQQATFVPVAPEVISNSFVRCFFKDSKNYMWIGTADGLIRYDGTNSYFYEHNPGDKTSISHNNINAITEDSDGKLWIATAQGLCTYNRETDNFIYVDSIAGNKNHLNNFYITSLAFDRDGQLWIGTHGNGIDVYNPTELTFTYLADPLDGNVQPSSNYINSLLCVDGLMWCGTKGGLKLYNTNDKEPASLTYIDKSLPVRQISQVVRDKVGNIWLATVDGEIYKMTPRNGYYSFQTIVSDNSIFGSNWGSILTFCADAKGNFWIGGENSGLNYLDVKTRKITRFFAEDGNPKKLQSNSIRSVYMDDKGLIWVGTFNKGAYLIDNGLEKFERYRYGDSGKGTSGKEVRGFAEDRNGNIWIAYNGVGLSKLDSKTNVLETSDVVNEKLTNKYLTSPYLRQAWKSMDRNDRQRRL